MPTPQANELSLTKLAELTREVRDRNNKSEDRLEGPRGIRRKARPGVEEPVAVPDHGGALVVKTGAQLRIVEATRPELHSPALSTSSYT